MAKIPLGNFGMQIAQAAPRVNIPAGAFDTGGSGMARAGDALMNTAGQMMQEQRQQDLALTRAKAANSVLDREIAVDTIGKEIEQQVSAGAIPHTEAKTLYKQRISEIAAPEIQGLDPVTAENLSKGMKRIDFKGEGYIDGVVSKAVTIDFRTQADSLLDKLGKKAGLPGADLTQIKAQADSADEIGVRAYGAAWGKKKQDWIDGAWDAQLNQQAMGVRDNLQGISALQKRITEGDYAENLDSNRRNALVAKLDMYKTSLIQRQEAAASRAQREQERVLKRAEAEFNTFQTLADKGTIMSPEYIDRAVKMTAGTPYQQGIQAIAKQAQETGGLAAQSIRQQESMLTQINTQIAQSGITPELNKRREQIQKVLTASQSDLKDNGIGAGLERGVIREKSPIDISTPEAFASSVSNRLMQAETVSMWAGKAVSPLDAAEADSIRGMLEAMPPKLKSQAVATIAEAVGPKMATAMSAQIEKQDRPLSLAFAHASSKTSYGRYTSELILKGATAIKDGAVMKDDKKVTGWKATIATELDGVFPDERVSTAAKESAYYIAAGIAQEKGGTVGTSDIRRAVEMTIGGSIIERNGKKLPTPGEMTESEFDARLRSVQVSEIMSQTGSAGSMKSPGMVDPGNIDLTKRPTVKNSDGSISTVRSMSVNFDGQEVLLPTVVGGKVVSAKEAIDHYRKTGEHLGKFNSQEAATAYAEDLHNKQASAYTVRAGGVEIPVEDFVKSIPGQELMYAGPGRYAVIVRGRPVTNAAGKPIIIGVK